MIVITNPTAIANEIYTIQALFENGLDLLHIRKPDFSEIEMQAFVSAIGLEYRRKLVLHQQHQLSEELGIHRLHNPFRVSNSERVKKTGEVFSTSTHSIEAFNALTDDIDYAFLSPVFPSISKEGYHSNTNLLDAIKKRTNYKTKLIALGGIQSDKIASILDAGFDDFALLGTIWNSNNPVENFKVCQQIVRSF